jgi:hypothetical protein
MLFLMSFLAALAVRPIAAQSGPAVISPRQGEALQGVVTVKGSSDMTGFLSSEIAFAYAGDPTGTWFPIAASSQPVADGTLATWDTTTITDGDYVLRLRVYLTDGSNLDIIVANLRVRNYTPVETPTPAPTALQATLVPTATLMATPFPTLTALPRNPAALTPADISTSIACGGLAAVLLLLVLGVYLWLRRK